MGEREINDAAQVAASDEAAGYYAFNPETRGNLRFVVLDTVSEGGIVLQSSNGNVDDPQFRWLKRELARAQRRDQLIVVFGHHATGSLTSEVPDEAAAECTIEDDHSHDTNPGCDRDPRDSQPLHGGKDLEALFHRFPNVLAYVAGHSHESEVQPFDSNRRGGEFWEIKSPAIVDWPPQHRLIEVMDNRDGTLSVFATLLDQDSPSEAPGPAGEDAIAGFDSAQLASIGRTIAFNDPQEGPDGSEGRPNDRNVELLLRDPREKDRPPPEEPPPEEPPPTPPDGNGPEGPGDGEDDGGPDGGAPGDGAGKGGAETQTVSLGAAAGAGGGGEPLPFTGLALGGLALVGAALASAGVALRRRAGS